MSQAEVRVGAHGRVVIPAEIRRALGVTEGSSLIATVEGGRLVLEDRRAAARRLRGSWKELVPSDRDLVRELLDARNADVALDDAEAARDADRVREAHDGIAGADLPPRGPRD